MCSHPPNSRRASHLICSVLVLAPIVSKIRAFRPPSARLQRGDLPCIWVYFPDELDAIPDAVPPLAGVWLPHHVLLHSSKRGLLSLHWPLHDIGALLAAHMGAVEGAENVCGKMVDMITALTVQPLWLSV